VSEDDVVRAVGKLRCLGSGFGIVTLPSQHSFADPIKGGGGGPAALLAARAQEGSGLRTFVKSVPMELDKDATSCLAAAGQRGGRVGLADLTAPPRPPASTSPLTPPSAGGVGLGWDGARAGRALAKLTREGLAWVDAPVAKGGTGDCFVLAVWLDDRSSGSFVEADGGGNCEAEGACP
jgi:hypothetical protein